ncbi:3-oxoacyl-[acyl-carrier-protein] synthase III C-terminal domain-containing protein [Paraburkholderia tropica]|uniref:3-oxoacyl-[acyl-carrier-protein] synthase III C-terminal domain-containing protein n=1 Tax=Paraburkholderia tropica TaxID=92647 RepID=UPI002AB671CD|nr:3-oxoacyl-[acyl-carrier-protein] synthase III C-terminal domain-containing protein [Paraburkholderia tropica]
MQSVYADTLRWRCEASSGPHPGSGNHCLKPEPSATAAHVACEPGFLLSDMASMVAGEAIRRCAGRDADTPDHVVVCATSLEHDLALSCACRLHSELGVAGLPFAIGQLQAVSFFLALHVVSDMMANDHGIGSVLIVGAERWLPPFSRLAGSIAVLGDGAAAVVIGRHTEPGWLVLAVSVRTCGVPCARSDIFVDETLIIEVVGQACTQATLSPAGIDWIVPPHIDANLACRITAHAGLSAERMWYPQEKTGYLCSADAPAQLDALLQEIVPSEGQRILLWSVGLQGQAACAILEYRGN